MTEVTGHERGRLERPEGRRQSETGLRAVEGAQRQSESSLAGLRAIRRLPRGVAGLEVSQVGPLVYICNLRQVEIRGTCVYCLISSSIHDTSEGLI